jgi:hypothetical protein
MLDPLKYADRHARCASEGGFFETDRLVSIESKDAILAINPYKGLPGHLKAGLKAALTIDQLKPYQ